MIGPALGLACWLAMATTLSVGPPVESPTPWRTAPTISASSESAACTEFRSGPWAESRAADPTAPEVPPGRPVPAAPTAPRADRWLAEDKLRHLALSFAITELTYATARFGLSADPALATAAGTALLVGLGKELHDRRSGGPGLSLLDLAWDLAGVALGTVLARQIR